MAGYDSILNEIKSVSSEDYKTSLGIVGMHNIIDRLEAVEEISREQRTRRSNNSIVDYGRDEMTEYAYGNSDTFVNLTDNTMTSMIEMLRVETFKVRLTNALRDIVIPLADRMELLSLEDRLHSINQHGEDVFYQQEIVEQIKALSEDVSGSLIRSIILEFRQFARHPILTSFNAIDRFMYKPLKTLVGTMLFGYKRELSDTERIVNAVEKLTEFMMTGQVDNTQSIIQRIIQGGIIGGSITLVGGGVLSAAGMGRGAAQRAEEKRSRGEKLSLRERFASSQYRDVISQRGVFGGLQDYNKIDRKSITPPSTPNTSVLIYIDDTELTIIAEALGRAFARNLFDAYESSMMADHLKEIHENSRVLIDIIEQLFGFDRSGFMKDVNAVPLTAMIGGTQTAVSSSVESARSQIGLRNMLENIKEMRETMHDDYTISKKILREQRRTRLQNLLTSIMNGAISIGKTIAEQLSGVISGALSGALSGITGGSSGVEASVLGRIIGTAIEKGFGLLGKGGIPLVIAASAVTLATGVAKLIYDEYNKPEEVKEREKAERQVLREYGVDASSGFGFGVGNVMKQMEWHNMTPLERQKLFEEREYSNRARKKQKAEQLEQYKQRAKNATNREQTRQQMMSDGMFFAPGTMYGGIYEPAFLPQSTIAPAIQQPYVPMTDGVGGRFDYGVDAGVNYKPTDYGNGGINDMRTAVNNYISGAVSMGDAQYVDMMITKHRIEDARRWGLPPKDNYTVDELLRKVGTTTIIPYGNPENIEARQLAITGMQRDLSRGDLNSAMQKAQIIVIGDNELFAKQLSMVSGMLGKPNAGLTTEKGAATDRYGMQYIDSVAAKKPQLLTIRNMFDDAFARNNEADMTRAAMGVNNIDSRTIDFGVLGARSGIKPRGTLDEEVIQREMMKIMPEPQRDLSMPPMEPPSNQELVKLGTAQTQVLIDMRNILNSILNKEPQQNNNGYDPSVDTSTTKLIMGE